MALRPRRGGLRVLLDTNAVLWWLEDPSVLARPAREAIEDGATDVYVSAASAFEIGTKVAAGKLRFEGHLETLVTREGFFTLPITVAHAVDAGSLPLIHRDPFDRLLIGQARVEHLTVATRDATFLRYGVPVLTA